LYALYPVAWRYCAELYVETALTAVVAVIFWLLAEITTARKPGLRIAAGLGAACGLAMLIKPNVILLPLIVAGVLLSKPALRRRVTAFAVVLLLFLAPWVVRNALVFGRPMLSSAFENNLALVSAPATLIEANHENVAPWTPRWFEYFFDVVEAATDADPKLFSVPEKKMTDRQRDQAQVELANVARSVIAAFPIAFVASHAKGAWRGLSLREHQFWFTQLTGKPWEVAVPGDVATLMLDVRWRTVSRLAIASYALFALTYAGVIALSALGGWRLFKLNRVMALAMLAFIAYMIVLPGPIAYERFHLPFAPLVCVLAACGVWCVSHASWRGGPEPHIDDLAQPQHSEERRDIDRGVRAEIGCRKRKGLVSPLLLDPYPYLARRN
jgi:4-amino-4-deoxy-L-arabinose transferase-like glycosyltransferase